MANKKSSQGIVPGEATRAEKELAGRPVSSKARGVFARPGNPVRSTGVPPRAMGTCPDCGEPLPASVPEPYCCEACGAAIPPESQ
jgi:hypothetical protein